MGHRTYQHKDKPAWHVLAGCVVAAAGLIWLICYIGAQAHG